jgi:hypothetical protein
MSQPVWVLSVDLQAKTATFTTGLAGAAKAARGSFNDISSGAKEMGKDTGYSMMEARHGVMMLGEEFGVHLPRAVAGFLAGLGPVGEAMEAAFPFLAIAALATILIERLTKMHEAGEKLTMDQLKLGTAVSTVWNSLDQKLLQAEIRADELSNNHLAALHHQLELLDKESLGELVHSFEELAKSADVVLKDLEGHWYTFGKGSEGAKNALDEFKAHYESLIANNRGDEASGLLHGTLENAQKLLAVQLQLKDVADNGSKAAKPMDQSQVNDGWLQMRQAGLSLTENSVAAQQNLVQVLNGQVGAEQRIADLKKLQAGNDTKQYNNDESAKAAAGARAAAQSQQRIAELGLSADKATSEASLNIHQASLEERLSVDESFAGRERDIKQAANQAEIAGLDKSGKEYANQLKALNDKTLEINAEYAAKVTELRAHESVEASARDLQAVEEGEREKIEATEQGSAARLAAINAAIKQEESLNLQGTARYRELLTQRVEAARQEADEEGKLAAESGKEEAQYQQTTADLVLAAMRQHQQLMRSAHRESEAQLQSDSREDADTEYNIKLVALGREIDALDKSGKDYQNKLKQLQDQEVVAVQQHENAITAIQEKAEQERNQRILAAENQFDDAIARGMTQSLMGKESWSKMMVSLGDQVIEGMMQNAIKSVLMDDFDKERDAAKAARKGWLTGAQMPFPANIVMAPLLAATWFAGVMAFEGGTDSVPGAGRGDVVPAMLSPGEGIVPGGVMDGLRSMARSGTMGGGTNVHVHVSPTYHVQTIDGDGMQAVLNKHSSQLTRHFEKAVRRMNR